MFLPERLAERSVAIFLKKNFWDFMEDLWLWWSERNWWGVILEGKRSVVCGDVGWALMLFLGKKIPGLGGEVGSWGGAPEILWLTDGSLNSLMELPMNLKKKYFTVCVGVSDVGFISFNEIQDFVAFGRIRRIHFGIQICHCSLVEFIHFVLIG